jgi:excisionase family DNA binding protein
MSTEPVTTAQAAERLKCDVSTIIRMAKDGRLTPSLKFGGLRGPYLFEAAEVERVAAELAAEARARADALSGEAASA